MDQRLKNQGTKVWSPEPVTWRRRRRIERWEHRGNYSTSKTRIKKDRLQVKMADYPEYLKINQYSEKKKKNMIIYDNILFLLL